MREKTRNALYGGAVGFIIGGVLFNFPWAILAGVVLGVLAFVDAFFHVDLPD